MALFDQRFGIKEVADVVFYDTGKVKYDAQTGKVVAVDGGTPTPVLEFTTLKTSGLEFTGETTEARGGNGNAVLMSWDHSREATLTLEDALLSAKSLATMLSNQPAAEVGENTVISINANGFPGTYTVVGKTYARGTDGKDHLLTFLIFKAKVSAEANLEMSADGDPSTLNMTLKVLRCTSDATDAKMGAADGDMIKLIIDDNTGTGTPAISFP